MRTLLLLWLFVAPSADTLQVMFWNVENFFDWRNDSTTVSDVEFSAAGERHWTWKRFQAKANAFAKAVFWTEAETGRLPDIIGLEEVENAFVLRQVLQKTALRKLDYQYVHYDSPDHRGIDVALLYRSSRLELIDSKPCHLYAADSVMATRDILLCVFQRARTSIISAPPSTVQPDLLSSAQPGSPSTVMPDPDRASIPTFQEIPGQAGNDGRGHVRNDGRGQAGNDGKDRVKNDGKAEKDGTFAVLVNHHPSKYGGAAESEPRRRIAVERLRFLADSLVDVGIDRIIAGGDFNDTPDNPVFRLLEPALAPMHMDLFRRGLGTIKFDGKWDLIDHIYVSPALLDAPMSVPASDSSLGVTGRQEDTVGAPSDRARMRILRIPFLLTRDTVHSGEKPLRTYTGPRHTGGVSDHLPVLLEVPLPP